jgi:HK97 family phage portal protein
MSELELYRPRQLSRWQRFASAVRAITLGPYNAKDPALARLFGGGSVSSGVPVNEQTVVSASAVWAAVNAVSTDVASVPLVLYKRNGKSLDEFVDHPVNRLIKVRPNSEMGSMVLRRTVTRHALIWGNGYAEIERDMAGRAIGLWPLLPYAVQPFYDRDELKYRLHNPNGKEIIIPAMDMVHIRGGGNDANQGDSIIANGRESFGLTLAAERFGSSFFGNGATFGGIIKYPQGINPSGQTRKDNAEALNRGHQGVDKAHRMLALYEGADFQAIGVEPNQAQFLETRQFQVEEVCRWFRVQPHKLHHLLRTSYNSIEHQSIEYATDTLNPWWVLWEQELQLKLVPGLEQSMQKIEHVRQGRLQADAATRGGFYSQQFNVAAIMPNEIRQLENRNPVEGGDRAFVGLNLIPLDKIDAYWDATIDKIKAPPPAPPQPKSDEDMDAVKAEADRAIGLARHAAQLAEDKADLALAQLAEVRTQAAADVALAQAETARTVGELQATAEKMRDDERHYALLNQAHAFSLDHVQELLADLELTARAHEDVRAALSDAEQTRDEANREAVRLAAEYEQLTAISSLAIDKAEEANAAHARTLADADALRAELATLRGQYADLDAINKGAVDLAEKYLAESIDALQENEAMRAEAETLRAELARARADIATELDRQRTQKATLLAAMRSLFVEATERLLTKESHAARKHQATPEKLRNWVGSFYDLHADTCRDVFRPLVGPWTAITGGAPGLLLDRLVAEHVETSSRALRLVAEAEDQDQMAAGLERTLRLWEVERGHVMADALVREGMGQ